MNKIVKRVGGLFTLIVVLVTLIGCNEVEKAEKSVNNMFEAFKNSDIETASNYVDFYEFQNYLTAANNSEGTIPTMQDSFSDLFTNSFTNMLLSKLQYKIISSEKIDGKTVLVTTEITTLDMMPIISQFVQESVKNAFANAFSEEKISEEEQTKIAEEELAELMNNPESETLTSTVDIIVEKTEKSWIIKTDKDFANAVFGGLIDVANVMNKDSE